MGLFAARPEEPFEWAGLPSEPLTGRGKAEFLEDPPADPFAIVATGSGPGISIAVPVAPAPDPASDTDGPAADDDADMT